MTDAGQAAFAVDELVVTLHKAGPGHTQWAEVTLTLTDTGFGSGHDVTIQVLVPEDSDASLVAIKQQAVDRAVLIGEAALAILRGRPVAELQAERWARDDARDAELDALDKDPLGMFKGLSDEG